MVFNRLWLKRVPNCLFRRVFLISFISNDNILLAMFVPDIPINSFSLKGWEPEKIQDLSELIIKICSAPHKKLSRYVLLSSFYR